MSCPFGGLASFPPNRYIYIIYRMNDMTGDLNTGRKSTASQRFVGWKHLPELSWTVFRVVKYDTIFGKSHSKMGEVTDLSTLFGSGRG